VEGRKRLPASKRRKNALFWHDQGEQKVEKGVRTKHTKLKKRKHKKKKKKKKKKKRGSQSWVSRQVGKCAERCLQKILR